MRIPAVLLALTVSATAQTAPTTQATAPGSNMPADFYPRSPCIKPQKVRKDSTARTSGGGAQPWAPMVNRDVEQFNQRVLAFNACIKLYVDNSRQDTQHILDIANAAAAQTGNTAANPAGSGNLPAGFYPRSPCIQPQPPNSAAAPDPQNVRGRGFVKPLQNDPRSEDYNQRVRAFNVQAAAFNVCMKTYMDNTRRDIEHVQSLVRSAVADANAPMVDPKGDFMTDRRR